MTRTDRNRHPILASVLAVSLATTSIVPPAMADPSGPRFVGDSDRGASRAEDRSKGRRNDAGHARQATRAPAPRGEMRAASGATAQSRAQPRAETRLAPRSETRAAPAPRVAAAPPRAERRAASAARMESHAAARPVESRGDSRLAPNGGFAPARREVTVINDRDRRGSWNSRHYRRPIVQGTVIYVEPRHVRRYRNVVIIRPFGHRYHGYGHRHHDHEVWHFLAFTAITLAILSHLSERQQRTHEQAQITAATAPIGQTIIWNDGNASGTVTPLRDGTSSSGAYCREFRQTVTIGGRSEEAYGTACRKPDGAWEVVSSGQ